MIGMHSLRCLGFCLFFVVSVLANECDKTKCNGPLAYYEALMCKPVYAKKGDCCAIRYDCSHLNERKVDKCYVNGREYAIGVPLKDEDANPCDIGCRCAQGYNGIPSFSCAVVDCFHGPVKNGCYRKNSPSKCCPGEEVCPDQPEDRATCVVDGKTYRDGEAFTVESDPSLSCTCQPGYKGKNIEPFCMKPRHPYCDPEFRHSDEVRMKCAPVYYSEQNPSTSCSVFSRCQNVNDTVIHSSSTKGSAESDSKEVPEAMMCKFGTLTMNIGDELNQATDYNSVCVKCVCEVPPTPTCQRLPDDECDITRHPPFLQ